MPTNAILRTTPPQVIPGGDGHQEIRGIAAFTTNGTQCGMDCPFAIIKSIVVTVIGGGTTTGVFTVSGNIGSISATASADFIMPEAGTISFVKFVTSASVTASDANYWAFGVLNKTDTKTIVDNSTAGNTTKATGGIAMTGYAARTLTITTGTNITFTSGAVIETTFTKTDTAPTMTGASVIIGYTSATSGTEELSIDATNLSSDGYILRDSNGQILVNRKGRALTSGLAFSFRITGHA